MPIYEFECINCKNKKEFLQKTINEKSNFCENCNDAIPMRLAISTSSFSLKGEGWYRDGYISHKPVKTKNTIKK